MKNTERKFQVVSGGQSLPREPVFDKNLKLSLGADDFIAVHCSTGIESSCPLELIIQEGTSKKKVRAMLRKLMAWLDSDGWENYP